MSYEDVKVYKRLKFNTQISKVHVKYLDFFKTKYLLHVS